MDRVECDKHNNIIKNMGWYLGVEVDVPICSRAVCIGDACEQRNSLIKELSRKLVDPELSEEARDGVRRKYANNGIYSFYNSHEIEKHKNDSIKNKEESSKIYSEEQSNKSENE